MGAQPKTRADDKRGARPGSRVGTPHEGRMGNLPHERREDAAILVREMSGYGMPVSEISHALNAAFDGGFSPETIERHYRAELDTGLARQKHELLGAAHKIAMFRDIPDGVSKDSAYASAQKMLPWLLSAVHKVRGGMEHDLSAGVINVTLTNDDAEL